MKHSLGRAGRKGNSGVTRSRGKKDSRRTPSTGSHYWGERKRIGTGRGAGGPEDKGESGRKKDGLLGIWRNVAENSSRP